jgi:hypothetical protein
MMDNATRTANKGTNKSGVNDSKHLNEEGGCAEMKCDDTKTDGDGATKSDTWRHLMQRERTQTRHVLGGTG